MISGRLSSRRDFTPVPSCGSVFVYMIPAQNVMPARVIPARVHPGSCAGARFSSRHETSFRSHVKRGMTVRFISIKVSSILWHYKTRTPTNTALCKHSATFHVAPEWKPRRYHVNTPKVKPCSVGIILGWVTKYEYPVFNIRTFLFPPIFSRRY